jgi:hypothetical protein
MEIFIRIATRTSDLTFIKRFVQDRLNQSTAEPRHVRIANDASTATLLPMRQSPTSGVVQNHVRVYSNKKKKKKILFCSINFVTDKTGDILKSFFLISAHVDPS